MNFLLKNLTILGESSTTNILIQDGIIQAIGPDISAENAAEKEFNGAIVSPGWMDADVQVGDPGLEHREDLNSAAKAAAAGGFTAFACQPNTQPVLQSKSEILYIKNNSQALMVDVYPIGALSHNCEGKEITEVIDMHHAGAIGFSDGKHSIQHSGLMLRALQYVKTVDGIVINRPLDAFINGDGQIHEGYVSTTLGIKGSPSLAEEMMIQRDLYLTAYAESKLLIAGVSTAKGVELIRQAKAEGISVKASVAVLNLLFDESSLSTFDSNLKVKPYLRSKGDQEALWAGLNDGTIDMIISNHFPLEEEAKKLEFSYAKFGTIGLETAFAALHSQLNGRMSSEALIQKLATGVRQVFGLPIPKIAVGEKANITIADPSDIWTFKRQNIFSKSKNTPFINALFKGRVLGVVNGMHTHFN